MDESIVLPPITQQRKKREKNIKVKVDWLQTGDTITS
jgi:hypothetical protein